MRVLHFGPVWRASRCERVQRRRTSRLACLAIVIVALSSCAMSPSASAGTLSRPAGATGVGYSSTPSSTEPYLACPPPTRNSAQCLVIIDPPAAVPAPVTKEGSPVGATSPAGEALPSGCFVGEDEYCGSGGDHGFSAQDLESAYKLPSGTAGSGQTVAIVDAYDDPNAQADLNVYRSTYGLPACESECFTKVNQEGGTTYPAGNSGWAEEISLDLDMVSAACPKCHILLVEAKSASFENLGIAENEAAKLGATEISNSYAARESEVGEKLTKEYGEKYYTHSGIPITVASGDEGYDDENPCPSEEGKCINLSPSFPAGLASVDAVGGTTLSPEGETGRGWSESVWIGSGSGCTLYVTKPAWQTDKGCAKRTDNDIAAEASPSTPVSLYDTYSLVVPGWQVVGGTSASTPLAAGAIALESSTLRAEGTEGIYKHASNWFDITTGSNWIGNGPECPENYWCHAEVGYDGPTGMGTPNGGATTTPPSALTEAATGVTTTGATLNGIVNPETSATTYYFQYGPSTNYGGEVPVGGAKVAGYTKPTSVTQSITGLHSASLYHFRVVAKSVGGTTYGADRTFSTAPKVYLSSFGSKGTTEGKFEAPQWTATDLKGDVWVTDFSNDRIEEFSSTGTFLRMCGSTGSGEGEFSGPTGIAVNPTSNLYRGGYIYVSDSGNNRIEVFSPECKFVESFGASGSGNGQLSDPMGLAFGSENDPYYKRPYVLMVADSGNNRIEAFNWTINDAQRKSGEFVATYGSKGSGEGQFVDPTDIILTGVERSYTEDFAVVDSGNNRIQEFEEEELTGLHESISYKYIRQFGSKGTGEGQFSSPTAIALDPTTGDLAVTDTGNNRVEEFLPAGTYVAKFGAKGTGTEDFESPKGISVSSAGSLNVADTSNNRVDIWESSQQTPPPAATTKAATGVTTTEATLNGTVNPEGQETTYHFEYGKTTSYGTSIPVPSASVGSGLSNVEESKTITGLEAGTLYHFRIVATNVSGTTDGEDKTFTTVTPSWRITTTPNPSETLDSYLRAASCTTSSACTAVGEYTFNASTYMPMAERWNGSEWALQSTPNPSGSKTTELYGVSCSSATACMAVGYDETSAGVYLSLTETWNGTEWKIQSTAEPTGTLNSLLKGVSCTSSTACTAVGWYENSSGVELPWAARWNGTAWSVQSVPAPTGAKQTFPYGVSCTSTTACTMAGYYVNSSSTDVLFAESWNGTEWKIQSTPTPSGATKTRVSGVSCTSSTACTLVGEYTNSSGVEVTLAERWNGTEWVVQSTPNPAEAKDSYLNGGVSCASSTACTAVGVSYSSASKYVTLAEQWNGTEWKIQSTPNDEKGEGWLTGGVSCSSSASCAAVGNTGKTFAEIYG
jgi:hypothetical protein